MVDGRRRVADAFGHLAEREVLVAVLDEDPACRVENCPAKIILPLLPAGAARLLQAFGLSRIVPHPFSVHIANFVNTVTYVRPSPYLCQDDKCRRMCVAVNCRRA